MSEAFEQSYSGNGLRQGSAEANSSFWIDHPPQYWTDREYVQAIQLKGNTLPTIGIPSNPAHKSDCSAECKKTESLSHVLQKNAVTHWKRIKRHDIIVAKVRAEKRGFITGQEPNIPHELNRSMVDPVGLPSSVVRSVITSVIRGSCLIHRDFMRLVWSRA